MQRRIASEAQHIWHKLSGQRARARRAAKQVFWSTVERLGPDDVAIDLGANAGEFTLPMARGGAEVHAFEPDPHALTQLTSSVQSLLNVTVHPVAVGATAGRARLYRTDWFGRDPDRGSKSSSLLAEKRKADAGNTLEIDVIDFPAFLTALDRDVALIKMDIEGAEVELLESLLDQPVARRIGQIFVETHERAVPALAPRIAALKARFGWDGEPAINWDWH